jgi:nucleoside-diphosphate-sugar epimerase
MGDRVLITGATGFLGKEVCSRLVQAGAEVRALARPTSDISDLQRSGVEIHLGDLRDTVSLDGAARDIDTVVHTAAAHRGGAVSRTDFWQVNAEGTKRLLQTASRSGVRRFIHISTAGVLGGGGPQRLATESDAPSPSNLYELTKWRAEQAVRRIAHSDNLEAVILRPVAVYGPGERRFLKLIRPIKNRRFVLIGSGRIRVHFIHRDDAVDAILTAMAAPQATGETFLLADDAPIRMRDLVEMIARLIGVPPPRLRVPFAPVKLLAIATEAFCRPLGLSPPLYRRRLAFFGTERAYSTDKARTLLGFRPKRDLAGGLAELVDWYRSEGLL